VGAQRNCADPLNHEQNPPASFLSAVVYRCADNVIQPQGGRKDVFVDISAVERAGLMPRGPCSRSDPRHKTATLRAPGVRCRARMLSVASAPMNVRFQFVLPEEDHDKLHSTPARRP
jgi:hypothetical protein